MHSPIHIALIVFLLCIVPSIGLAVKGAPTRWLQELCESAPSMKEPVPQHLRFGKSASNFEGLANEMGAAGFRPTWVDGYSVGNNVFFNAIFEANPRDQIWMSYFGQSGEQLKRSVDTLIEDGYRLVHIDMYLDQGQLRYTSIFVKEPGPLWTLYFGQPAEAFSQIASRVTQDGFRIKNLSSVRVNGNLIRTGLFDQEDVGRWQAYPDLTQEELEATVREERVAGRVIHYLDAYEVNGSPRFNVVLDERLYRNGTRLDQLSSDQFQVEANAVFAAGLYARIVTGYHDGNAARFTGLWTEQP